MNFFKYILTKFSKIQNKYGNYLLIIFFIFTLFMIFGLTKIEFEGDFQKEMPQDLPIFKLNDKITNIFSGQDTTFILIMLDDNVQIKNTPKDIREPKIMNYVIDLEESLLTENNINEIISISQMIKPFKENNPNYNLEEISNYLKEIPQSFQFISKDFTKTILIINTNVGSSQEKIAELTNIIEKHITDLSTPSGTKIKITGSPSILAIILDLLRADSIKTLLIASVIIIFLLVLIQRSFTQSLVIFTPILLGIIWTLGTLGLLNITISVATAGIGAMILGLGVEYGIFMITRFQEERKKNKTIDNSLNVAVSTVGSAIMGSGLTTMIGFLALTFSLLPLLQKLGFSLALGIFYCILSTIFILPVLIKSEEKYVPLIIKKLHDRRIK
ncbi:MAG: efflux RND transporter permease subunit [Candidatus Woesearchaeota archaeon]